MSVQNSPSGTPPAPSTRWLALAVAIAHELQDNAMNATLALLEENRNKDSHVLAEVANQASLAALAIERVMTS